MIFYHTLEGDLANGWKFANGKPTKTVKQKSGGGIGIGLKSASSYECEYVYVELWSRDCTNWYTQTETSDTHNGTGILMVTYISTPNVAIPAATMANFDI